jgi:dimethylglycine dehydrogenase
MKWSLVMSLSRFLSGELGWELYHKPSDTLKLYEALEKAGQEYGVGDFGTYALNSMRIEKGFRGWGAEVRKSHTRALKPLKRKTFFL